MVMMEAASAWLQAKKTDEKVKTRKPLGNRV
jgi:hypothetical protein